VTRHERAKQPREYMATAGTAQEKVVAPRELPFEFMLNALRLVGGVPAELYEERTGLPMMPSNPGSGGQVCGLGTDFKSVPLEYRAPS